MPTYTARWVFPVAGPPIPGGSVSVDGGRIVEVMSYSVGEDLGDVALLPGFVNAHTHLDLSGARGRIPPTAPDTFTDWLTGVIAFRRSRTAEQVRADYVAGIAEVLRFGTTLVGDILATPECGELLAASPLRGVLFRELIGLDEGRFRGLLHSLAPASGARGPDARIRDALSLHAPYSVTGDAELLRDASRLASPLAVHVAESPGELELLAHRTGPFVEFLTKIGVYRPASLAQSVPAFLAPLETRQILIHGNYLPADYPFAPHQGVVVCPRTHAAFGHPPHPFPAWLRRGVPVCLGTDSLASNPDLDPLAEAVEVRRKYPEVPPAAVLKMITFTPAQWLGFDDCGSLAPGQRADLVAVPIGRDADPYDTLFGADLTRPRRLMVGGSWKV